MKMPKHTDEDKARSRGLVPEAPGVKLNPESLEELRGIEHIATLPPKVKKPKK
jgi:hypothetical protein